MKQISIQVPLVLARENMKCEQISTHLVLNNELCVIVDTCYVHFDTVNGKFPSVQRLNFQRIVDRIIRFQFFRIGNNSGGDQRHVITETR